MKLDQIGYPKRLKLAERKPNVAVELGFSLLSLLIVAFLINSASAFTWQPNFYNYVNFTSINSIASYQGHDLGATGYLYVNLSAINNGYTPLLNYLGYVWLKGYNATGGFIGNVSAYPYSKGLLVSLKATNGKTYDTLSLFFNQSVTTDTYYYANYSRNASLRYISNRQNMTSVNNYVSFFGVTGVYGIYAYLTPSFDSQGCIAGQIVNPNCYFTFKPNQMYYFYQTPYSSGQNVSIEYINKETNRDFVLYDSNLTLSLWSKGFIGYEKVKQPSSVPLFAVINSTKYYLISNSIGANTSLQSISIPRQIDSIFNSTDQFFNYITGLVSYQAKIGLFNVTNSDFVLIPAYSSAYVNSSVYFNATPKGHTNQTSCNGSFLNCFAYRIPIGNIKWVYNFTTLAQYGHLGTPYNYSYGIGSVGYARINVSRYAEMGVKCQNLYVSSQNLSRGDIPFTILNCTGGNVELLIKNKTYAGFVFNSLYVYYDNINGYYNLLNTTLYNDWIIGHGKTYNIPNDPPYAVDILQNFNLNSSINAPYPAPSVYWFTYNIIAPNYYQTLTNRLCCGSILNVSTNIPNYKFLVARTTYGNKGLIGRTITALSYEYSNTIDSVSGDGTSFQGNLSIVNLSSIAYHLTTGSYNQSKPEYNPSYVSNLTPTTTIPRTIILPNSNTSIIPNLSNSSELGDQPAFMIKYGGTINFLGITMPEYYLIAISVLLIFLVSLFIASKNEFMVILGLIGIWATGLLTAISGNITLVAVALIMTLIYVVMNAKKWFK